MNRLSVAYCWVRQGQYTDLIGDSRVGHCRARHCLCGSKQKSRGPKNALTFPVPDSLGISKIAEA